METLCLHFSGLENAEGLRSASLFVLSRTRRPSENGNPFCQGSL